MVTEHTWTNSIEDPKDSLNTGTPLLEKKSHEIRTYMTRIISMTDLTLMSELSEEQQDYLTIVKSSTKLLLKVLNDVLDYAKLQTGKISLKKAPFAISELLWEVMGMFEGSAQHNNISLTLLAADKLTPKLLIGDALRIKQVLAHLLDNSLKFTKQGGVTIGIEAEEVANRMVLNFIVSDTGAGISADKLEVLNKSLSQIDDADLLEFGGAGLVITKKLIELMDGTILVESQEGIGSKVYVSVAFEV